MISPFVPSGPVQDVLASLQAKPGTPGSAFKSLTATPEFAAYKEDLAGLQTLISVVPFDGPAPSFSYEVETTDENGFTVMKTVVPDDMATIVEEYSAGLPDMMKQAPLIGAAASTYSTLAAINTNLGGTPPAPGRSPGCDFVDAVFKGVSEIGKVVGDISKSIVNALSSIDISAIISKVSEISGMVFSGVGDFLKNINKALGPVKSLVQTALQGMGAVMGQISAGITAAVGAVGKMIATGIAVIGDAIKEGAEMLEQGFKDLMNVSFLTSFNSLNPCIDKVKGTVVNTSALPANVMNAMQPQSGGTSTPTSFETGVPGEGFNFG